MSSSPESASVLMAQSLEPASHSVSASPPITLCLSVCLSVCLSLKNKQKKILKMVSDLQKKWKDGTVHLHMFCTQFPLLLTSYIIMVYLP